MIDPHNPFRAIAEVNRHMDACKGDKYNRADTRWNVQASLTGPDAKTINLFSACKYLDRYDSEGYAKSGQRADLVKAIHHLLIQLEIDLDADS